MGVIGGRARLISVSGAGLGCLPCGCQSARWGRCLGLLLSDASTGEGSEGGRGLSHSRTRLAAKHSSVRPIVLTHP